MHMRCVPKCVDRFQIDAVGKARTLNKRIRMYALALLTLSWRLKRLVTRLAAACVMRSCQIVRVEFFFSPDCVPFREWGPEAQARLHTRRPSFPHCPNTVNHSVPSKRKLHTTHCVRFPSCRTAYLPAAQSLYSVLYPRARLGIDLVPARVRLLSNSGPSLK